MPDNAPQSPAGPAYQLVGAWAAALLALLALPASPADGQERPPTWRTGAALDRQLDTPVELLRWSAKPLRGALESLASSQGVAMFLDRRIDPDQPLEFESRDEPLSELIARLAGQLRLGTCRVGSVIYLGPPDTAAVLSTVAEIRKDELHRAGATAARREQARPLVWPELANPRTLIARELRDAGLASDDLEQIPHDLWPAADLPALDFAERLSLLLAGFGMTFQVTDPGRLQLIPLPPSATLSRDYSVSTVLAERIADLVRQRFPEADVAPRPGGLAVEGTAEVHRAIERWQRGPSTPTARAKPAADAEVRYVRVEVKNQPLGAIAAALAERMNLQIEYDPRVEPRLQEKVSFRVEQVSRDQLLEALFAPLGLTFQITGNRLRVSVK